MLREEIHTDKVLHTITAMCDNGVAAPNHPQTKNKSGHPACTATVSDATLGEQYSHSQAAEMALRASGALGGVEGDILHKTRTQTA